MVWLVLIFRGFRGKRCRFGFDGRRISRAKQPELPRWGEYIRIAINILLVNFNGHFYLQLNS